MQNKYKILILIAAVILISSLSSTRALYNKWIEEKPVQNTQLLIEKQFDAATGAHIALEKLIKQYIPNLASYQHISSDYQRIQDQITVNTKYSALNTVGKREEAEAIVVYHVNGRMINLLRVD